MRVIYHPQMLEEIVDAAQFYEGRLAGLGEQFLDEIDQAACGITEAPERYAIIQGNIRRCLLRRFPYGIYYRVLGDVLRILVIKHHSRHPDFGLERE